MIDGACQSSLWHYIHAARLGPLPHPVHTLPTAVASLVGMSLIRFRVTQIYVYAAELLERLRTSPGKCASLESAPARPLQCGSRPLHVSARVAATAFRSVLRWSPPARIHPADGLPLCLRQRPHTLDRSARQSAVDVGCDRSFHASHRSPGYVRRRSRPPAPAARLRR